MFCSSWATRLALVLGGFLFSDLLVAQCVTPFTLGPDTTLCTGQSLVLNAPPGYTDYLWTDGSSDPTLLVTAPGTYGFTTTAVEAAGNLVTNGDFNAGATGFTSDYIPGTSGTWGPLTNAGTYGTAVSPMALHSLFEDYGDHTTGTGNMLVVNGAQVAGQNIWCQTVAVQANTAYAFSAWLSSAAPQAPAQLQFTVNGVAVGTLNATPAQGVWSGFQSIWNSGAATVATICITNLNVAFAGNDFAIDDIMFAPYCTYYDEVVVSDGTYPEPDLGPDAAFCSGSSLTLEPNWPGADTYIWQDGSTAASMLASTPGVYWVDVSEAGCVARDSIAVDMLPLPEPDLGPDAAFCTGSSLTLEPNWPGADTFVWQDGSTGTSMVVSAAGIYWVDVSEAGCVTRDSINVDMLPLPAPDLGLDQRACDGETIVLDATEPGATYIWQDGSTASTFAASTGGTYHVTLEIDGCLNSDSVRLVFDPLPIVELGADTSICADTSVMLDVYRPDGSYLWDDGSSAPQHEATAGGIHWVIVTESGCSSSDSIIVDITEPPQVVLGEDINLCIGGTADLVAGGPGYDYLWSDGSTSPVLTISEPGEYTVVMSNACGVATDAIIAEHVYCDCPVYVPVAFTPDNDGVNDQFLPVCECPFKSYLIRIYDRWGGLQWESADPDEAWSGVDEVSGVFVWALEYRSGSNFDDVTRELRGHVVVLR